MAKQYEVAFAISGKMASSFKGSLTDAGKALDGIGQKIKALDKVQTDLGRWRDLKTAVKSTEAEFSAAQARVRELALALKGTDAPTKAMQREFEQAKRIAGGLKDKLTAQRTELQTLRGTLAAAGVSTSALAGKQKALALAAEKARAAQSALQGVMLKQKAVMDRRAEKRGQLLDAAALAVSMAAPIRAAMNFESSMADVRKVVDFDTPEQFKQMGDDILRLGRSLPMAHDGIAAIVAAGGQAGFARGELLKFAEDAAKMGVAFDVTADEAGQMMAGWRTAFRMGQDEVRGLADKINYLGNTTAASAPKISEIVTRVGALGEVAGVDSGGVAALGATLASMNIPAEVAATGIQNLLLALNSGEAATKKQQGAYLQLGLDAVKMAKMMQQNAPAAIELVMRKLAKLKDYERAAVMTELFGKESIKAIAPLLNNLDTLNENFRKVGDSSKYAGSMQKEYEARAATSANSGQLLMNSVKEIGIAFGSVLLPPLAAIFKGMASVANVIADVAKAFPWATAVIGGTAAALIGLKVAAIAGGYAMTFLQGGALMIHKQLLTYKVGAYAATMATNGMTAATGAFNAIMAATPIGWVVAGVAALAAVGLTLWKYWEPISAFFKGFWAGLVEGLAPVREAMAPLSPLFAGVSSALGTAFDWLMKLLEPLKLTAEGFAKVFSSGKAIGSAIGGGISKVASWVGLGSGGGDVPAHATGGYFDRPHLAMIGDAPETIVPHKRTAANVGLWAQAGRALGVGGGAGGGGGITISYSPQITIAGNADAGTVTQALELSEDRLRRMFERVRQQDRRLALA